MGQEGASVKQMRGCMWRTIDHVTGTHGCGLQAYCYLSPPGRESLGHMEGRDTNPAWVGLAKKFVWF